MHYVYSLVLATASGVVLGRALGTLHEICNDVYFVYRHRQQTVKTQWVVAVCTLFWVHAVTCDSRDHANAIFTKFKGPRALFDTHKYDRCGHVRAVLYGGRLSMQSVSRMRRAIVQKPRVV
jgi:hypothetical protein